MNGGIVEKTPVSVGLRCYSIAGCARKNAIEYKIERRYRAVLAGVNQRPEFNFVISFPTIACG